MEEHILHLPPNVYLEEESDLDLIREYDIFPICQEELFMMGDNYSRIYKRISPKIRRPINKVIEDLSKIFGINPATFREETELD